MNILQEFLADWRVTGALAPTSQFARKVLLDQVDFASVQVAVELGPGTGAITRSLLERLAPDATLLAVEINASFVRTLRASFADPRLRVVEGSATETDRLLDEQGLPLADCVISALPFSTLPEALRSQIMASSRRSLKQGAPMLSLQYSPLVMPGLMEQHFGAFRTSFCLWNIPPAFIYRAERPVET